MFVTSTKVFSKKTRFKIQLITKREIELLKFRKNLIFGFKP
jgi:hypothetical protein